MLHQKALRSDLPLAAPEDPDLGMVLLLMRRIAAKSLHEQEVAALAYQAFGRQYERPLTLVRAYLIETATAALNNLQMVGGDHPRMTRDEGLMLEALALAGHDPELAQDRLAVICGVRGSEGPLAIARLLANALSEMGCLLRYVAQR